MRYRDDIVKMAKEAGIDLVDGEIYGSTNQAIFAFADLVRAAAILERDEYKIWWQRDSAALSKVLQDLSMARAVSEDRRAMLATAERERDEARAERDAHRAAQKWWDQHCARIVAERDSLRDALDRELVSCGSVFDSFGAPRDAINALIEWHTQVAIDPAVSSDAAALRDTYKDERDALRRSIEHHNATCDARGHDWSLWKIPLPAADAPNRSVATTAANSSSAADAPEFDLPPLDPWEVECARCHKKILNTEAVAEEGDEWECFPCNERENERERREATGQGEKPISDDVLTKYYDDMAHFDFCPACATGLDAGLECPKCHADFMPIQQALAELIQRRLAEQQSASPEVKP